MNARLRTQAAMLSEPSTWQLVERMKQCADKEQPAERPVAIDVAIRPMTKAPACPLCSLNVNACECDPFAYEAAVYAQMSGGAR